MESLISYESDEDNKEHSHDLNQCKETESLGLISHELDVNYDQVEMDESDEEGDQVICASSTKISPEDAPLVFRPSYAPGDDIRCTSLDSRNSSDMEMDDSESDFEAEIQIIENSGDDMKENSEEEVTEEDSRPTVQEETEAITVLHDDNKSDDVIEPKPVPLQCQPKNMSNCCKRPHSPERPVNRTESSSSNVTRSPERPWKSPRVDKKTAVSVLNQAGFVSGTTFAKHDDSILLSVKDETGIALPSYYNPAAMNPLKYAQQIQKRQLLWGNKSNESKPKESSQNSSNPWSATTFKNDNDGKMTEKFKRLMGIKVEPTVAPPVCQQNEVIEKQEEMFSNMEAQYQLARMVTHTHRGVGLGYASHSSRSSLQKNS